MKVRNSCYLTGASETAKHLRILHTSDVHLGEGSFEHSQSMGHRTHQSLEAVVSLALREQIDLLIIAGDLFEHNRIKDDIVDFVLQQFCRLTVPVIILPGNHDCLVPESVYLRIDMSKLATNIRVFTAPQGQTFSFPELDLEVWGKPITSYGGALRPLVDIPSRSQARWQIAVAHGHYTRVMPHPISNSQVSFQISEDEIVSSRRDYVALGHWSIFTCVCNEPVKAYYCGSPPFAKTVAIVDFIEGAQVQVTPYTLEV